jgi:hypothetical protein
MEEWKNGRIEEWKDGKEKAADGLPFWSWFQGA